MGEIKMEPITVRYAGIFDFDGLYVAVIDWAKNYGYRWHESSYKHKIPSPAGAKQELDWEITKNVTEYIQYEIKFTVVMTDLKEIEIKGKNLSQGQIYIVMKGNVIFDWQEKFKGSKFAKKLGEWYLKLKGESDIDTIYWDQLYYRMWNLHAIIKKYLDLQGQKYAYKGYLKED